MSTENAEDIFDDVIETDTVDEGVEAEETEEEVRAEEKPVPRGYMSKDAWVEAGRDPDDWVSPEVFKERGERIKMKNELQKDFDNRFKNLSVYYQKQMEIQRNELLSKRDDAIDVADKAAVKAIDKQLKELDDIEELNKPVEQQAVVKPQEVVEWEEDNPWCNDPNDPRLPLAQRVYVAAINSGKTPATALRLVDKELSAKFIDKSKKPAQIAEGSRQSPGRGDDSKPTMGTLSAEEKKIWDAGVFDSKEDFLKAVHDDRKAKAGKK